MKFIKEHKREIIILLILLLVQDVVYFGTKLLQPYQIVLNNRIDDKIPFIPEFCFFYTIWYLFLFLVPLIVLKYDKQNFNNYVISCLVFQLIEVVIFVGFPTTIIRHEFEVNSISSWLVDFIYKTDTPVYNCFPSGHCAYAIFFILSIFNTKKSPNTLKYGILFTSIGIILSTLFIKQHVIIDVIGAFIIVIPLYYFIKKQNIDLERNKIYATLFRQRKKQ